MDCFKCFSSVAEQLKPCFISSYTSVFKALAQCIRNTHPVSPRRLQMSKEMRDSLKVHCLSQKCLILCSSALLCSFPLDRSFPQFCGSPHLSLKSVPLDFTLSTLSALPSLPQILLFSSLSNSAYLTPPVKLGQPCCPCAPVLGAILHTCNESPQVVPYPGTDEMLPNQGQRISCCLLTGKTQQTP